MSVINQMLKDLEKNPSPSQSNLQTGMVTVAQPRVSKKLLVALMSSIALVTGLAAYLLMQDTFVPASVASATAKPSIAELASIAPSAPSGAVSSVNMVPEPTANSRTVRVSDSAEQAVQATLIQNPVVGEQTIATPAPTVASQVAATPVALAESTKEVTVQPPAKKQVVQTNTVVVTKPRIAEPVSTSAKASENSISIQPVTRTRQQQAQLYAQQAEQALLAGDKEQAKLHFNQALKLDDHYDQAREKLAALLYGEKRTKSAVAILREGLAVSPEYTKFRLMLARIYMQNKDKQQAYYYLKPHQPEIAGNIDYYAMLAGLAQNTGDLDTARSAYLKLTAHEPSRAKWWLGLGITADKLQQRELALTAYHKAQMMGQLSAASRNYIDTRITQLEK